MTSTPTSHSSPAAAPMTPITPIHIQLLSGPANGRKATIDSSPITFGRDANNSLVLVGDFVSRVHGEMRFENGQWVIENLSPNGTKVSRKKLKTTRPLRGGEVVQVGNEPVFSVHIEAPSTDAPTIEDPDDEERRKASRRTKLWIGIGVYMVAMLALLIFFKTNQVEKIEGGLALPKQWTDGEIESALVKDFTHDKDDFQAQHHLKTALELTSRLDDSPEVLYQAHRAFKESLGYQQLTRFDDPGVQAKFHKIETQYVKVIQDGYALAYNTGAKGDYERGADLCRDLVKIYRDRGSDLHRHIEKLQRVLRKASVEKQRR